MAPDPTTGRQPGDAAAHRTWLRDGDLDILRDLAERCSEPTAVDLAVVKAARSGNTTHSGFIAEVNSLLTRALPVEDEAHALVSRAAHEAGHVAVAVAMGLSVMHSDITAEERVGGQTGTFVHDQSPETTWAGVVTAMGGAAGERAVTGTADLLGASEDIDEAIRTTVGLHAIGWTTKTSSDLLHEAITTANLLIDANTAVTSRVTQALLDVGALHALDILRLTEAVVPVAELGNVTSISTQRAA